MDHTAADHSAYIHDMGIFREVSQLSVRDRRAIFANMRQLSPGELTATRFFPQHGMFTGEIALVHVLMDIQKRRKT